MSTIRANALEMLDGRGKGAITFDNVQEMVDSTVLAVGQKVRTLGYYAPGDGGGNDYEIVAAGTGTDDGGSFIDLAGSGNQAKGLFLHGVSINQFGAKAGEESTASIQAALDYSPLVTGSPGEYLVSDDDADDNCIVLNSGNKFICGGKSAVTIKQDDNVNARNVIHIAESASDVTIAGMTVDANRDNNTTTNTRGISGSRGTSKVRIRDVEVANAAGDSLQSNSDDGMHDADDATTPFADGFELTGVSVRNAGTKAIRIRRTRNAVCRIDDVHVDARVGEDSASGFETANAENVVCHGANILQVQADRGPGYRITNGSKNITIMGGTVNGGRQNLFIGNSERVTITGVTGVDAGAEGISISNSDDELIGLITANVTINGCTIINPNGDGCTVRVTGNGTETSNINILGSTFIGGGAMPFGISSQDNVGGQKLTVKEFGNTIIGVNTSTLSGDFTPIQRSGIGNLYSYSITITDDGVFSFDLPTGTENGVIEIAAAGGTGRDIAGACVYRASGAPSTTELYNGKPADLIFSSAALTGTTGADGVTTVSVDGSGLAYIENRTGAARAYSVSVRVAV